MEVFDFLLPPAELLMPPNQRYRYKHCNTTFAEHSQPAIVYRVVPSHSEKA